MATNKQNVTSVTEKEEPLFPNGYVFSENVQNPVSMKGKDDYIKYLFECLAKAEVTK